MNATRQFAVQVVQRLRASGFEALWAGGCVRDLIMGHEPSDYDVATAATPDQVRGLFGHRRTLMVGASFGVVIVQGQSREQGQVEVATFRTDASYSDGRRPDSVTFSTPQKDAQRRDFTINGMFFDPLEERLIDYVDGQADLKRGLIRAIGDPHARIAEDKLRMLRAVRFAARFGFELEPHTSAAIQAHANEVSIVSGERIAVELRKMLLCDRPAWAMAECQSHGLLSSILPEAAEAWSAHGAQMQQLLTAISAEPWVARIAALYWPLVDSQAGQANQLTEWLSALRQRLHLSNDDHETLRYALQSQTALERADRLAWSALQPWLIKPGAPAGIALLAARQRFDSALSSALARIESAMHSSPTELNPPHLINGQDLQQAGLAPGPTFRVMLQRVRDLQLDGELNSQQQAMAWLAQHLHEFE